VERQSDGRYINYKRKRMDTDMIGVFMRRKRRMEALLKYDSHQLKCQWMMMDRVRKSSCLTYKYFKVL
jgi:hypothetical protein